MKKYNIPKSKLDDNDTRDTLAAMYMAMKRAHKMAHQTGTKLAVIIDGKPVYIDPDPELYGDVPDIPPSQF